MEETRKVITMKELEEIMASRTDKFDASSVDAYGFSVDMLCTGIHFDKSMDNDNEYVCMILLNEPAEVQIDPSYIEEIYLDEDGTITIEFNIALPDLEIKYRN